MSIHELFPQGKLPLHPNDVQTVNCCSDESIHAYTNNYTLRAYFSLLTMVSCGGISLSDCVPDKYSVLEDILNLGW